MRRGRRRRSGGSWGGREGVGDLGRAGAVPGIFSFAT